jgi:NAD(P)-dependent dehydrogenase (short-subunit alcohol dehydrogenase family)
MTTDCTAVITGASTGIGATCVERLAPEFGMSIGGATTAQ